MAVSPYDAAQRATYTTHAYSVKNAGHIRFESASIVLSASSHPTYVLRALFAALMRRKRPVELAVLVTWYVLTPGNRSKFATPQRVRSCTHVDASRRRRSSAGCPCCGTAALAASFSRPTPQLSSASADQQAATATGQISPATLSDSVSFYTA